MRVEGRRPGRERPRRRCSRWRCGGGGRGSESRARNSRVCFEDAIPSGIGRRRNENGRRADERGRDDCGESAGRTIESAASGVRQRAGGDSRSGGPRAGWGWSGADATCGDLRGACGRGTTGIGGEDAELAGGGISRCCAAGLHGFGFGVGGDGKRSGAGADCRNRLRRDWEKLGRRAVLTAMREQDRTGKDSELGKRLLRELGCANWSEVKTRAQTASDEVFPRMFSVVAALAESGDATAQGILRAAAYELTGVAVVLAQRLRLSETEVLLAKMGRMTGRSKLLDEILGERLRVNFPQARIGALPMTPAEAAGRMALELREGSPSARA